MALIVVANGAPVVAQKLPAGLYDCPVDGGRLFFDSKPLFGTSKTVRGLGAAFIATIVVGLLIGIPVLVSLLIAFFAMAGDLFSSFIKRRMGKPPGSMFIGLDQIPESLLPLLAVKSMLGLQVTNIVIMVAVFVILELWLSRILYKAHIRKHPY